MNKIGTDTGKISVNHDKNLPVKNALQIKAGAHIKSIEIKNANSIFSLIKSLGLPQDKLSASVLSFSRFFSLPLKADNLPAIRRQAISGKDVNDKLLDNTRAFSSNLRFALAAAAAESKGVELQPKGLELFAEAIDPDQHKRKDNDGGKERRNKEQNEQEKTNPVNAENLKKNAVESAENNPVLSIMNKLPCKSGQRWIVLPFEFNMNGEDFYISMRVLLEDDKIIFMALGINKNRHSFALRFSGNNVSNLIYYCQNPVKGIKQDSIKQELASLFNIPCENVCVNAGVNPFPEEEYGEELLRFIDEAA